MVSGPACTWLYLQVACCSPYHAAMPVARPPILLPTQASAPNRSGDSRSAEQLQLRLPLGLQVDSCQQVVLTQRQRVQVAAVQLLGRNSLLAPRRVHIHTLADAQAVPI